MVSELGASQRERRGAGHVTSTLNAIGSLDLRLVRRELRRFVEDSGASRVTTSSLQSLRDAERFLHASRAAYTTLAVEIIAALTPTLDHDVRVSWSLERPRSSLVARAGDERFACGCAA